jgi:putative addiction module component (TIGR02574 family)
MNVADNLLTQALNLPTNQRAELAQRLLESLPDDDDLPVIPDEELEREIARRIEDHRLGRAKTVDLETFSRAVREAAKRSPS